MSRTYENEDPSRPILSAELPRQGYVESFDGTRIYYETHGQENPLLFCYGLACRKDHFHHQAEYFEKSHRIIHTDYRGHQASAIPFNDHLLTVEACAEDVAEVIRRLGLPPVALVGHSMGSTVALYTAAMFPDRVKAVVVVGGALEDPLSHMFSSDKMQWVYRVCRWIETQSSPIAAKIWRLFSRPGFISYNLVAKWGFNRKASSRADIQNYVEGVFQTPWPVFMALLTDTKRLEASLLKRVRCPVLIIAGEKDSITPLPVMQRMASQLERAELFVVPEGSHNAHVDFPDVVNPRILEFLKRC